MQALQQQEAEQVLSSSGRSVQMVVPPGITSPMVVYIQSHNRYTCDHRRYILIK